MEKSIARVRFEELDSGCDGESSASEAELSGNVNDWSEEEGEMSGDETRRMVTQQNRKGKKSGGFQSMGMQLYRASLIAVTCYNYYLRRSESSCIHWYNAQRVQSSNTYSKKGVRVCQMKKIMQTWNSS